MRDLLIRLFKDDDLDHPHHDHHDHPHHDHHDHPHHNQVGGDVNLGGEGHDGLPAVDPVPQVLRNLFCFLNQTAVDPTAGKYFNLFSVEKTFPNILSHPSHMCPNKNLTLFQFK